MVDKIHLIPCPFLDMLFNLWKMWEESLNQIKPTPCKRRILAKKPHHSQVLSYPRILQQVIRDYVSSFYLFMLVHSLISLVFSSDGDQFFLFYTPLCDNNQTSLSCLSSSRAFWLVSMLLMILLLIQKLQLGNLKEMVVTAAHGMS